MKTTTTPKLPTLVSQPILSQMNINRFQNCSCALLLISALPVSAQVVWQDSFRDAGDPSRPFTAGGFSPLSPISAAASGYALQANSAVTGAGGDFQVRTLARFDAAGMRLWTNRLDPEGTTVSPVDLLADPENPNRFFASADEAGNTGFRFGLYNGANAAPVFARAVAKNPNSSHQIEFFTGTRMGGSFSDGTTIDALVVDDTGTKVFSKRYTSPNFVALGGPFITQSYIRGFVASRNQYLTAVGQVETVIAGVPSFTTRLLPFFTDLAGGVTSAGNHSFTSGFVSSVPFPSAIANDALLYRIPASDLAGNSLTHFVKINANGTLGWARTLAGGTFLQLFPRPDGLYLAGSVPQAGGPAGSGDAAVLCLDPATGNLVSQAVFNSIRDVDVPNLVVNADSVFVTINSFDISAPSVATTTLVKLGRDLTAPAARRYTESHAQSALFPDGPIASFERLLFSPFSAALAEVRAITLDLNLDPVADCPIFAPVAMTASTPLSLANLAVTTTPLTVNASDITIPAVDTTLPVAASEVAAAAICGGGGSAGRVTIEITPGDPATGVLRFATAEGVTYSIRSRTDLSTPFAAADEIGTVAGDGTVKEFPITVTDPRRFYVVSPPPPM
jgi:hypothetical protein